MVRKRNYTALQVHEVEVLQDAPIPLVHNIVGTTQIHSSIQPINLYHLSQKYFNSNYNKQKFAAITIRLSNPDCTALLFTSGKMVLTGAKNWYECLLASLSLVRMFRSFNPGVEFHVQDINIQNIVGDVKIPLADGFRLDIECMFEDNKTLCTYQPNLFPGLIYRPNESPVVLICFFSGKIVITGGKCVDDIRVGWYQLWPFIARYIKQRPPTIHGEWGFASAKRAKTGDCSRDGSCTPA